MPLLTLTGSPALSLGVKETFNVTDIFNQHGYVRIEALPLKRPEDNAILLPDELPQLHEDIKTAVLDQYARNPLASMKAVFLYFQLDATHENAAQRSPQWHNDDAANARIGLRSAHRIDCGIPVQIYLKSNIMGTILQNQPVHHVDDVFINAPHALPVAAPVVRQALDYEMNLANGYNKHTGARAPATGQLRGFFGLMFAGTTELLDMLRRQPQTLRSSGPSALNWD
jgi:hypothetical protein